MIKAIAKRVIRGWGVAYAPLANNGRFVPGNNAPGETWLQADYTEVVLSYESPKMQGQLFVTGRFNWWQRNQDNRMYYDAQSGSYVGTLRLKQGYYDYRYELVNGSRPAYHTEGSYFQAENEYQILVYHRAPGDITDKVVFFQRINSLSFF